MDYGPVGFLHVALAEQLVHAFERFGGAGKGYQAADGAVDAVDGTQEHGSRLIVFFLDVVFHHIQQAAVARGVALDQNPRRFVDDDEVIVFVNDLERFHVY